MTLIEVVSEAEVEAEVEDLELAEEPAPVEEDYEDELTRVVKSYMPLVRHAVNRLVAGSSQSSILQYEDMVSCGVQGLLEAHRSQVSKTNIEDLSILELAVSCANFRGIQARVKYAEAFQSVRLLLNL